MRTYNEHIVKGMTREQFLEQHPEAGTDYDRIVGVKEDVKQVKKKEVRETYKGKEEKK